jgi:hypothetical protein
VSARPLPDDRALLLRMLDETHQFLIKATEAQRTTSTFRKLHDSQEAKDAFSVAQQSIDRLRDGRPPLVTPGRLKVLYPVLDRLAALNQKRDQLIESLGPPLLLTSKYLDFLRTPAALRAWLSEKPTASAVIDGMIQSIHRLHEAILEKLERELCSIGPNAVHPTAPQASVSDPGERTSNLSPPSREDPPEADPLTETLDLIPKSTLAPNLVSFLHGQPARTAKLRSVCKHIYKAIDKGSLAKARRLIDRTAVIFQVRNAPLRLDRNRDTDMVTLIDR